MRIITTIGQYCLPGIAVAPKLEKSSGDDLKLRRSRSLRPANFRYCSQGTLSAEAEFVSDCRGLCKLEGAVGRIIGEVIIPGKTKGATIAVPPAARVEDELFSDTRSRNEGPGRQIPAS